MGITEEDLCNAVRMSGFIYKDNSANMVGDFTEQLMLAVTTAFVTKFTRTSEIT